MIYKQDGIDYKIENDVLKGWFGTSPFTKPTWNGSSIVEGWTQADQDALDEVIEEVTFLTETIAQLEKGDELAKEIFSFVRKHSGLTDNQKTTLKSLAVNLFSGQIEEALTEWATITRPTQEGKMQKLHVRIT